MASLRLATTTVGDTANPHLWIPRALEILWLLTIVLVPLVFLGREFEAGSSTLGSFELPKIVILRLLVGLMASLWLIEWGLQARISGAGAWNRSSPALWLSGIRRWLQERPNRWLYLAVAFFAGATLLSTVLSASLEVSLWGEVPGQDSYSAYTTFAYVLLVAVISSHLRTQSQLWRLLCQWRRHVGPLGRSKTVPPGVFMFSEKVRANWPA